MGVKVRLFESHHIDAISYAGFVIGLMSGTEFGEPVKQLLRWERGRYLSYYKRLESGIRN